MTETLDTILAARRQKPDGLRRTVTMSFAVHTGAALALIIVPRLFPAPPVLQPIYMTVSLGGTPGPTSGGLSAASARPVEKVEPPAKRPAPILPATPPKIDPVASVKAPLKQPSPKASDLPPTAAPPRPPAAGAQIQKGSAAAETGAVTPGQGLTVGGGAGGSYVKLDDDFCCPDYVSEVLRRISERWNKDQQQVGETILVFEIRRDGSFSRPEVEKSSGDRMLDLVSLGAFTSLRLPPLPEKYKQDSLKIHLGFPYKR